MTQINNLGKKLQQLKSTAFEFLMSNHFQLSMLKCLFTYKKCGLWLVCTQLWKHLDAQFKAQVLFMRPKAFFNPVQFYWSKIHKTFVSLCHGSFTWVFDNCLRVHHILWFSLQGFRIPLGCQLHPPQKYEFSHRKFPRFNSLPIGKEMFCNNNCQKMPNHK